MTHAILTELDWLRLLAKGPLSRTGFIGRQDRLLPPDLSSPQACIGRCWRASKRRCLVFFFLALALSGNQLFLFLYYLPGLLVPGPPLLPTFLPSYPVYPLALTTHLTQPHLTFSRSRSLVVSLTLAPHYRPCQAPTRSVDFSGLTALESPYRCAIPQALVPLTLAVPRTPSNPFENPNFYLSSWPGPRFSTT